VRGAGGEVGQAARCVRRTDLGATPFRGSWAVQCGLLSRCPFARSALLAPGQCVLSGYSAAELLGAACAPAETNVELTVPGGDLREQPGLTVHRDLLADDEITDSGGVPVTTALRTAWDLARWLPTVEAVVAMDALARIGRFTPHSRAPDSGALPADTLAPSSTGGDRPLQSPSRVTNGDSLPTCARVAWVAASRAAIQRVRRARRIRRAGTWHIRS
jgi:hypothetical protein